MKSIVYKKSSDTEMCLRIFFALYSKYLCSIRTIMKVSTNRVQKRHDLVVA